MPFPNWKAGARINPAKLFQSQTQIVAAANDSTVNNSQTVGNDFQLFVNLEANSQYIVEVHAAFVTNTTADFRTAWNVPSGTTGTRMCIGATNTSTGYTSASDTKIHVNAQPLGSANTNVYSGDGNLNFVQEYAFITTGATAGTLNFMWAQGTATAINTVRQRGSFMKVQRFV